MLGRFFFELICIFNRYVVWVFFFVAVETYKTNSMVKYKGGRVKNEKERTKQGYIIYKIEQASQTSGERNA